MCVCACVCVPIYLLFGGFLHLVSLVAIYVHDVDINVHGAFLRDNN